MARQNDRNVGRVAQRVAITSALTVIACGIALASAETAFASTTQASVFWKELDRIEDTNGNGALGDPGDTAYWNFYGGGIHATDTDRFTIDDPMIFGDEGFTIDSEIIRPGVDTVHRLDDARAELEAEAGEVLGNITPRPERSDYESTDDHGETVFDDELFIQDTEMYHQAVAEHSEYVAAGIAHSETFQDHGFRWAVAPETLGEQGLIFSHEITLPSYVARMQFEHVIRQDDITVDEDGSCTLVSVATSNYGATDPGVARDAATGEQINDFPVEGGYAAVQTVTAVDCAPEVAAPELTPSQTPNPEPEVLAEKDIDLPADESASSHKPASEGGKASGSEEDLQYSAFNNPDRVEPTSIDAGNPATGNYRSLEIASIFAVVGVGACLYAFRSTRLEM